MKTIDDFKITFVSDDVHLHGHISGADVTGRRHRRETNRCYYIAFEGWTEYLYFDIIRKHKCELGIPGDVNILRLSRNSPDADQSDPHWIFGAVKEYKHALKTGEYSARLFVSNILQQLFDMIYAKRTESNNVVLYRDGNYTPIGSENTLLFTKKEFQDFLQEEEREIIMDMKMNKFYNSKDEIIVDNDDAFDYCIKELSKYRPEFRNYIDNLRMPENLKRETFDESLDKFCIVIDRDRSCPERKKTDMLNLISSSEQQKIFLALTNPAFEFWIALHFNEMVKEIDEEKMLANPMIGGKRYSEEFLNKRLIGGYSKFRSLENIISKNNCQAIKDAIANAKTFECKLIRLVDYVGTNIPELLEMIQQGR